MLACRCRSADLLNGSSTISPVLKITGRSSAEEVYLLPFWPVGIAVEETTTFIFIHPLEPPEMKIISEKGPRAKEEPEIKQERDYV